MNLKRMIEASRLNLRMAGLSVLLCSALICTPQTVGWLCNTAWAELGFEAPPLLEEEVLKHNVGSTDEQTAVKAAFQDWVLPLPRPSDERILAGPLAKVSVPPPEAC